MVLHRTLCVSVSQSRIKRDWVYLRQSRVFVRDMYLLFCICKSEPTVVQIFSFRLCEGGNIMARVRVRVGSR